MGYVGETGGDGVQAFELAQHMARRGSQVTLIVPNLPACGKKPDAHADCPNLRVICTPLIRYDTVAQNPLDVFRLLWPLRNDPIIHLQVGDICPPRVSLLLLDVLRPRALFATIHAASPDMPFAAPAPRIGHPLCAAGFKPFSARRNREAQRKLLMVCP